MPEIHDSRAVDPNTLSPAEKSDLADALYRTHCEIFDGVDREAFISYVLDSPADRNEVRTYHDEDGEIVGYVAFHAFRRSFGGERATVVRGEAGLKRAWRSGSPVAWHYGLNIISQRLRDVSGPLFWLGCLIHPSSYAAVAKTAQSWWPHLERPTPPELTALVMDLAEEFKLPRVDPDRPLVRRVGWITRDTPAEARYWARSRNPHVRYFIEQNPTYGEGTGLLTLVPLNPTAVAAGFLRWSQERLSKQLRRLVARLPGLERRALTEDERDTMAHLLAQVQGLSLEDGQALLAAGTRELVPRRTVICEAGAPGEDLFVTVEGAFAVLLDDPDEGRFVVEQLTVGDIFGEVGALTGAPRTATVRAARDSVVVRIPGEALRAVVARLPEVRRRLWDQLAEVAPELADQRPDEG